MSTTVIRAYAMRVRRCRGTCSEGAFFFSSPQMHLFRANGRTYTYVCRSYSTD
jgi:hypothetical protein